MFVQHAIGTRFIVLRTLLIDGLTPALLKHFTANGVLARTASERCVIHECVKSLMHDTVGLEPHSTARAVPGTIVRDILAGKISNELA
jgi:hypothetical protein